MIKTLRHLFWMFIEKADEEHFQHPYKFCVICDERLWPWQKGIRLYELGMNRAHVKCAADFCRAKIDCLRQEGKLGR